MPPTPAVPWPGAPGPRPPQQPSPPPPPPHGRARLRPEHGALAAGRFAQWLQGEGLLQEVTREEATRLAGAYMSGFAVGLGAGYADGKASHPGLRPAPAAQPAFAAALIAFISARLDEDEAAAKGATPGTWHATGADILTRHPERHWDGACAANASGADGDHIARHGPERVLRDIAAKRKVLEWYADAVDASAFFQEKLGTGAGMAIAAESYLNVLRGFAPAWSSHPDYRAEWAA